MGKCQGQTIVYSRITGYYQPTSQWNPGKAEEFSDRKKYTTSTQLQNDSIDKVINKEKNYVRLLGTPARG